MGILTNKSSLSETGLYLAAGVSEGDGQTWIAHSSLNQKLRGAGIAQW